MARLCEVRSGLATMVLSDEWKVWAAGDKDRKTAAEKFRAAVMDEEWWGVAEFFSSLMAVPFRAMRATDSSAKGMMGKLYDIMLQLTEDINDKLDASGNFLTRTERADITKIVKDSTVVPGNIPDAPIPRGYNMDEEEEDDLLGGEGDDAVLADEYGEGVVVEKPRKEIGSADLGGFRAMHPAWRLEALQLAAVHHPPARGSHAPPRLRGATGSSATMWGAAAS
ncbi:unnamed protein product [Closterium sp. NIES-64]|nr:unnamed protein product [Closterium sp. NIES-64]